MTTWHKCVCAVLLVGLTCFSLRAQEDILVPQDSTVRQGRLENGLSYYIRHNDFVPHRADFYIVQNVGSVLEKPGQRGLAHFLEHLAFNGTKHFPDKELIQYLERIGVKFGGNLNAYTGVDKTVYMIKDVPVQRSSITDSCLLILRDWSDGILLDEEEINKERGVIEEEWRSRSNYMLRMFEQILPQVYKGSKYADCMPIGHIEVIRHFAPDSLRAYYHTWYRPDLQGIIVVGDVDVATIEAKIRDTFASATVPENAPQRLWYAVPDNELPQVVYSYDKEASQATVLLAYKHDIFPWRDKNRLSYQIQQYINQVVGIMAGNRLEEIRQQVQPPFSSVEVQDGQFLLSVTKDAWCYEAITSDEQAERALETLLTEHRRICLHGFTEKEYARAKADVLTAAERAYKERNTQKNGKYVQECLLNFTEGEPLIGADTEYALVQQLTESIPLSYINQTMRNFGAANPVVWFAASDKAEGKLPSESEVLALLARVQVSHPEAYQEQLSDEPLVPNLPPPGQVVSQQQDGNQTTLLLSNGVKVTVQVRTEKEDEVLLAAQSKGGLTSEANQEARSATLRMADRLAEIGGLGNFTTIDLNKRLAGKHVRVSKSLEFYTDGLRGECAVKDIETLLQLVYLHFTGIRNDEEAFQSYVSRIEAVLKNQEAYPMTALSDSLNAVLYENHPLLRRFTWRDLSLLDYEDALATCRRHFANAADFEFYLVGQVDVEQLKPMLEKYIAVLPTSEERRKYSLEDLSPVKRERELWYKKAMETPKTTVVTVWSGELPYTLKNKMELSALQQVLNIVYFEKVREENGGTYGVHTEFTLSPLASPHYVLEIAFETDSSKVNELLPVILREVQQIASRGPRDKDVQKVKEYMRKQHTDAQIENAYWLSVWKEKNYSGVDIYTDYSLFLEQLSGKDLQKLAKKILKDMRVQTVVQQGVANR